LRNSAFLLVLTLTSSVAGFACTLSQNFESVDSAVSTLVDGAVSNSEGRYEPVDVYAYAGDSLVGKADFDAGIYVPAGTRLLYAPEAAQVTIDLMDFVNAQLAVGTPIIELQLSRKW
jgi:hypothetical protein